MPIPEYILSNTRGTAQKIDGFSALTSFISSLMFCKDQTKGRQIKLYTYILLMHYAPFGWKEWSEA